MFNIDRIHTPLLVLSSGLALGVAACSSEPESTPPGGSTGGVVAGLGGTVGTGGTPGTTGGVISSAGGVMATTGGVPATTGGTPATTGGTPATTGGTPATTGGTPATTGGTTAAGGTTDMGGSTAGGGTTATGGTTDMGGSTAGGGATATGGSSGTLTSDQCSGIGTGETCDTMGVCDPRACGIADVGSRNCSCTDTLVEIDECDAGMALPCWDCNSCQFPMDFVMYPFLEPPAATIEACAAETAQGMACTTQSARCVPADMSEELCVCWYEDNDSAKGLVWDCDDEPNFW